MPQIKLLLPNIINKIAAGEVIERPASVIKELIENSIDADTRNITINIRNGGRNFISILDDGHGINKDDMPLALQLHTTSKLQENDIKNIKYLGFRGEALASIASVSRMKIKSQTYNNESWEINIEGGNIIGTIKPTPGNKGTYIEVSDLFYFTPNRLKFLKTEKNETDHIINIINRLAICYSNISFSLTADNKKIFLYRKQNLNSTFDNYIYRLSEIKGLGKNFCNNSIYVKIKNNTTNVHGHIGAPTLNFSNSSRIYMFINNRPIQDNLIFRAIRVAYQDFLAKGRYPALVIYLDIPNNLVDINVHPTKSEVRFAEESRIFSMIVNILRQAIHDVNQNNLRILPENTCNSSNNKEFKTIQSNNVFTYDINKNTTKKDMFFSAPLQNVIQKDNNLNEKSEKNFFNHTTIQTHQISKPKFMNKQNDLEIIKEPLLGFAKCQLHTTYIISEAKSGVFIIDQHAAHERIIYEKMKESINNNNIQKQHLLTTELIELEISECEMLLHNKELLFKFGITFDIMGNSTVLIREIPIMLGNINIQELIHNIITDLSEIGTILSFTEKLQHICGTIACHNSIRAGRKMSIEEMNALLRQIENTQNTGQCNHGRPTYTKISIKELEKLFERT